MSSESGSSDSLLISENLDRSYTDIINLMKCKHIAKGLTVPDGEGMVVVNTFGEDGVFQDTKECVRRGILFFITNNHIFDTSEIFGGGYKC